MLNHHPRGPTFTQGSRKRVIKKDLLSYNGSYHKIAVTPTTMQFENPIPIRRFDFYSSMSQEKLPFPEELPVSTNPSDHFPLEHDSQHIPIVPRQQVETSQQLSSPTYRPTSHDILCGRGRGSFLHEGNKVYLSLLRQNIQTYTTTEKRVEKSLIIKSVVSSLKERGFRFLKQEERTEGWYELTDDECYNRTAHALRDLIRKKKPKGRRNTKKSASRSSSPTTSVSSESGEETEKKPRAHSNDNMQPIPLQHSDFACLSDNSILAEIDVDSFDEQISDIPTEVMSPTDRLKESSTFDIFFEITPNDFSTILTQLDTGKQERRNSGGSH